MKKLLGLMVFALLLGASYTDGGAFTDGDALLWAANSGDLVLVRAKLESGTDVDYEVSEEPYASGYTALLYATQSGHLEIVDVLLVNGADVNHLSFKEQTALELAIILGHEDIGLLLIASGADTNLENALNLAKYAGRVRIVSQLGNKRDVSKARKQAQLRGQAAYDVAVIKESHKRLRALGGKEWLIMMGHEMIVGYDEDVGYTFFEGMTQEEVNASGWNDPDPVIPFFDIKINDMCPIEVRTKSGTFWFGPDCKLIDVKGPRVIRKN